MRDRTPPAGCAAGAGIANGRLRARFASGGRGTPPLHSRPHDHPEHHHTHRPRQSNFGLAFGLTIAIVAIAIIAILALAGREEPPGFSELKTALGVPASGGVASLELGQVEFVHRLDTIGATRQSESFDPRFVYLYYKVKEGQAQIVLERGAWEAGTARIKQIALR